jgi:hypothetical protein
VCFTTLNLSLVLYHKTLSCTSSISNPMSSTGQVAYLAGFKRSPLVVQEVEEDRLVDDDEIVV